MKAILAILLVLGGVFLACMMGAVMGAVAGFVVGLLFDDSLRLLAYSMGISEARPYQLGGMFGFLGGFFRSAVEVKKG